MSTPSDPTDLSPAARRGAEGDDVSTVRCIAGLLLTLAAAALPLGGSPLPAVLAGAGLRLLTNRRA